MIKNYISYSNPSVVDNYILLICNNRELGGLLKSFFEMPDGKVLLLCDYSNRSLLKASFWKKITTFIRKNQIDIVHSHVYKADFIALILKLLLGIKIVSTVHGYNPASNRLKSRVIWLFYRMIWFFFDKVILVSEAMLGIGIFSRLHKKGRVDVMRNFIPEFQASYVGQERDNPLFTIICIGRLAYEKNQMLLCKALSRLESQAEFQCLLIGDGPERPGIERFVMESNLQGKIKILGFEWDVFRYYQMADVCVIPSLHEGLALVMLEAMSQKCPIVAADISEIHVALKDGNGLLFERDNPDDLARKIRFAMKNTQDLALMAEKAYLTFKERYSVDASIRVLHSVYELI